MHPTLAGHPRSRALDSLLVSSSSQFLRILYSFFPPSRLFPGSSPTQRSTMILEKHLRFIFFSYLCHYQVTLHERYQLLSCFLFLLDRNTIIFEGQKTGNEGSRSGAKGKRLLTVQVLEVTSKVSKNQHF